MSSQAQEHQGDQEMEQKKHQTQNAPVRQSSFTAGQADAGYVEGVKITEGTTLGQFFSTVKKNVVLKFRDPVNLALEVIIPVVFVLGIVGIWAAIPNDDFEGENLLNNEEPMFSTSIIKSFACINTTAAEYAAGFTDSTKPTPTLAACNFSSTKVFDESTMTCFPETNNEVCILNNAFMNQVFFGFLALSTNKPIPELDEMVIMLLWGRNTLSAQSQGFSGLFAVASKFGKLHLVGDDALIQDFRYYIGNQSFMWQYVSGTTFDSVAAANAFTTLASQESKVWGIVSISEFTEAKMNAALHFNKSGIPDTDTVQDRFVGGGLGTSVFQTFYGSGFLTWQKILNEFYYAYTNRVAPEAPALAPMPYVAWTNVRFLSGAGSFVPLLVVFSFLYPVSQQTKRLVEEKEKRVREAMLIMGLGSGSFYLSHWLTYNFIYLVTSLLCSILFKLTVFEKTDFFLTFLLFYLFTLSCISLASLFSSVFSKSRLAALLSPLFFFIVALPFFAVQDLSAFMQVIFALLSPSAFAMGVTLLASYEASTGMGWSEFANPQDDFTMFAVFFFLIFDTVWYFLLALWFDNILPSEWGTQEHCCFCYLRCAAACRETRDAEGAENDGRDPKGEYEPNPRGKPSISLKGLRKEFTRGTETFVAVNDLTLNLYEGQISVILGHNGAGKTTAINLMTGMLAPDAGDCLVYGKSVLNDMRGVRQEIGFCPQHNILWDDMTCREHLEYFAKLKGLGGADLDDAVLEMIRAVDLEAKLDQKSSSLSGGMKRKLSVAIAFVGRSRVVFLDEPTAGMDVMARRHTWDLIKRMSPGRTIVLTTHYMDEADLLGNSISIMGKGKLKCRGSSLFLKSRLGVGYTLNCAIDLTANVEAITDSVMNVVTDGEILSNVPGEVSYRLPMGQVSSFPVMLRALEDNMTTLGLRSFGLSVTTLEEVFLKIGHNEDEEEKDRANTPQTETKNGVVINENAWHENHSQASGFGRQFTTLFSKRFSNAKRDTRTQIFQIWMPVAVILFAMVLSTTGVSRESSTPLALDATMYSVEETGARSQQDGSTTPVETPYADCYSNFSNDGIFIPIVESHPDLQTTNATAFSLDLQSTYKNHALLRMTALFGGVSAMGGPSVNSSQPYALHNTSGLHAAPESLQQYYRTNLRARFGTDLESTVYNQPLDYSEREDALISSFTGLFIGIFVMIPFTFIPSTFVSYVVKERECKAKHAQMIAGMSPVVYWISNFCFDVICFIGTNLLAIIIFAIFNRTEYVGGVAEFFGIFILFLFYAASGITGAYFCSFAFDNHGSAQNVVMLGNFLAGFLLVIAMWFFNFFESTQDIGEIGPFFCRIIPAYCLGEGILNMASRDLYGALGEKPGVFDMDVLGWNIVYMAIEVPLFMFFTMFLDSPQRAQAAERLFHHPDTKPQAIEDEDVDVKAEREEVEGGSRENDLVLVKNLCKKYPNGKVAVKNMSFGVRPGEVFGFLGTNGAGKTSTMSILCGEQIPTHGRGFVGGYDVVEQSGDARRVVGYCPQFDALLDLLNAEEHLYLYAGLRGINPANAEQVVESLIAKAGLTPHRSTLSMNMSGGNKRKLSVAIALIGSPTVVILDEPSAGMDPMARRGLWGVIETVAAKCAIVLTTHHLEEVEALANRVAIMDQGMLRCIGTPQDLKHKFGSGFEMSVRVESEARCVGMRAFMTENFPDAKEEEFRQQKFTYALPEDCKLSTTFELVEAGKVALGITDYSISQTSLEQVFMRIGAAEEDALQP